MRVSLEENTIQMIMLTQTRIRLTQHMRENSAHLQSIYGYFNMKLSQKLFVWIMTCISPVIVMYIYTWMSKKHFVHTVSQAMCGKEEEWGRMFWSGQFNVDAIIGPAWAGMAIACPAIIIFRACGSIIIQYKYKEGPSVQLILSISWLILSLIAAAPLAFFLMLTGSIFFPITYSI